MHFLIKSFARNDFWDKFHSIAEPKYTKAPLIKLIVLDAGFANGCRDPVMAPSSHGSVMELSEAPWNI